MPRESELYLAKYRTESIGGQEQADHSGSVISRHCLWVECKHFVGFLPLLLPPPCVEDTQLQGWRGRPLTLLLAGCAHVIFKIEPQYTWS